MLLFENGFDNVFVRKRKFELKTRHKMDMAAKVNNSR